jgi:hypothetical protein
MYVYVLCRAGRQTSALGVKRDDAGSRCGRFNSDFNAFENVEIRVAGSTIDRHCWYLDLTNFVWDKVNFVLVWFFAQGWVMPHKLWVGARRPCVWREKNPEASSVSIP